MRCFSVFLILFLVGCTTTPKLGFPEYEIKMFVHQYELLIVDVDGVGLEGAKIEYTLEERGNLEKYGSYVTKLDGRLVKSVRYIENQGNKSYVTKFDYKVTKEGYYPESGTLTLTSFESSIDFVPKADSVKSAKVALIKPIDYLTPEFADSEEGNFLKEQLFFIFIDLVRLEALLADTILELHSIGLISFKEKEYLTFKFVNSNVYNSLKLSKYDIGGRLFDEVVRKILNPLNDNLGGLESFYGYEVIVIGHTKDFLDKYAKEEEIEYRFMIPKSIVEKYKNKDITGQTVLNESTILMDDERIELKLQ